MTGNAPTLINLPPPPSEPMTPSDMGPGTPNSTTTSMSELSTVAIKDGHRGHLPHSHHQNPMDAERADRISRLAGLERVAAARPNSASNLNPYALPPAPAHPPTQGYFDANNQPQIMRERSTVGSASATGSVGGRTTWASGSDVYDPDKMSEDTGDMDTSSVGGVSDEGGSLVAFGEGARTPARQLSSVGSPVVGKATPSTQGIPSAVPSYLRDQASTPMSGVSSASAEGQRQEARMIDGMTYDPNIVDTVAQTPPPANPEGRSSSGTETAERILRERIGRHDNSDGAGMSAPDGSRDLGKFHFEGKQ